MPQSDLDLIALDAEAAFVPAANGRILAENEPTPTPAPKMFLAGCRDGVLHRLRADIDKAAEAEIARLVAEEHAFDHASAEPRHLDRYCELLRGAEPRHGLTFLLPHRLAVSASARFVYSSSREGVRLHEKLARDGMPEALAEMGFVDAGELWPPWCVALQDDSIVAMAFAARLGPEACALGLATHPERRGRGLGAGVTSAWTHHPQLAARTLFYGCARGNASSLRVVERLGLRLVGPTIRFVGDQLRRSALRPGAPAQPTP